MDVLRNLLQGVDAGDTCVLATVAGVRGSAPRKDAARMLVSARGPTCGTVGGGEVEAAALAAASEMLAGPDRGRLLEIAPQRRLLVVGAGHVGQAVAAAGSRAGYRVTVASPGGSERALDIAECESVAADDPAVLNRWENAERTQVVVATGDADADAAWAVAALARPFAGVGVVGSRNKAAAIRHAAAAAGVPPDRAYTLRCPVGLDLGAVTPEEIAVSIVAELIRLDRTGEVPEGWRRASQG
jgi:xanthine dehydrogenase accessory factor